MANTYPPKFFRNEVVFSEKFTRLTNVVDCTSTSSELNFINSELDWMAANKNASDDDYRLCSIKEISSLFDNIRNNTLTYTGAYIPAC
jgi:hypothetical protein